MPRGARPLEGNGRLILHIVPLSATTTGSKLDLELALKNHQAFRPLFGFAALILAVALAAFSQMPEKALRAKVGHEVD